MNYINIITKDTELPTMDADGFNLSWEDDGEFLRAMGWRIRPDLPPVADGYERGSVAWIDGDGVTAQAVYTDTLIQDRLDREAVERARREQLAYEDGLPKVNILTQETSIPTTAGGWMNVSWANQKEMLKGMGWRIQGEKPALADGYQRVSEVAIEGDGETCAWQVVDRLTADIEAEQAQSEATRRATPIVYDQPIEAPFVSVLSQTGAKGIGITATDEGVLVPFIVHESPWPDKDALQAKIAMAVADKKAKYEAGKAGIHGQLQARIENIERFLGWRV